MKIKIIAEASKRYQRLLEIWGLSILIDEDILFDTFSTPKILKRNIKKYDVDINKIKHIVISHDHWDHTGGLWWLLENNKNATVYICKTFSNETKEKIKHYTSNIIEVDKPIIIRNDVYSTGTLDGLPVDEQSLIIKNKKNIIITGCAHSGLFNIIKKSDKMIDKNIDLLTGGFHLSKKSKNETENIICQLKDKYKIKNVAPCHCTGNMAQKLFKKIYNNDFIKIKTGTVIEI